MPITIKSTGMKYKNPDTGVYQGVDMLEEATIRDVIVDVYSPTLPYAVGEYCLYNGELYCCTTAIPAGGETWNSAHWDKTNVTDELESINSAREAVFDAGTTTHDDCNNFVEGLVRYSTTTLNTPESGYGFIIGYVAKDKQWKWQIAITTSTIPKVFIRNNINNGVWNAWKRLANEDAVNVLTQAASTESITFVENKYIKNNVGVGETVSLTPIDYTGYRCAVVECSEGDKFILKNVKGASTPRLYSFLDRSNAVLEVAAVNQNVSETYLLTAPTGSAKVVFNDTIENFPGSIYAFPDLQDIITHDTLYDTKTSIVTDPSSIDAIKSYDVGIYRVAISGTSVFPSSYGLLEILKGGNYCTARFSTINSANPRTWRVEWNVAGSWYNNVWTDEQKIVKAALDGLAPTEISIAAPSETLSGTERVKGWKSCNGIITLEANAVTFESGTTTGWRLLGTLPVGARPSEYKFGIAYTYGGSGISNTYAVRITTEGSIQIMSLANNIPIYFSMTYV